MDDSGAAEKFASTDRSITAIQGYKLVVKVRPVLPHVELDFILKEKMKAERVKRCDANVKASDLSRFRTHPHLVDSCVVPLFRPSVLLAVLDIIVESIPALTALDLSDKNTYSFGSLTVLPLKVPNLRVLHNGINT
jgi:hypothetical protein